MLVLTWYGYSREPQVMAFLPKGSRALQPIVLYGHLIFWSELFCKPISLLLGSRKSTKKSNADMALDKKRFARQQWRARIETRRSRQHTEDATDSPASNGGRGLKRLVDNRGSHLASGIRPPAMAGAD